MQHYWKIKDTKVLTLSACYVATSVLANLQLGGRGASFSCGRGASLLIATWFFFEAESKIKKSLHLNQRECCILHVHASFQR